MENRLPAKSTGEIRTKPQSRRQLGLKGEQIACHYLQNKGYKILRRGFRSNRKEIDIIAAEHQTAIFVEVKARRKTQFGFPEEAVDSAKQEKIKMAAAAWLREQPFNFRECRFDVISVIFTSDEDYEINHLQDAF